MGLFTAGQSFAGYRLVGLISRGGMGEVWRATKSGQGGWAKQVALKVILPTMSDEERFVTMFLGEARIAAQLDHPNIVPVFASGRDGDVLWFEQEFIDGEDLARLIGRAGQLPVELALYVTAEVLKALRYAHEARGLDGKPLAVVHRDVKPHNVLIAREGHVKLGDFGIAKATAETSSSASEIKGTAGYIAPEVLDGAPPTASADLFGAGLILWEALVGKKLFDGETDAVRLRKTFACVVPPLAESGVRVAPEVEAVLQRLLARTPGERFATAAIALDAILAAPGGRSAGSVELKIWLAGHFIPTPSGALPDTRVPPPTGTVAGEASVAASRPSRRLWILALVPVAALAVYLAITLQPTAPVSRSSSAPTTPTPTPTPSPTPTPPPPRSPTPPPSPSLTQVTIRVTPSEATLVVNGVAQPGTSPFELPDRDPNLPLDLQVSAAGYTDYHAQVTVQGARMTIPIELVREPAPHHHGNVATVTPVKPNPVATVVKQQPDPKSATTTKPTDPTITIPAHVDPDPKYPAGLKDRDGVIRPH